MKKLKYIKTFEDIQSIGISSLYDTGASGAFGRWKNENPAQEFEENIKTVILNPVSEEVYNIFRYRNYSETDNKDYMREFIGKDGNLYLVQKDFNRDKFVTYDVNNTIKNGYKKTVAIAFFDVQKDFFSGHLHNDSINVEPEYRRKGIASAMTDFAEEIYKIPYKPSRLLSDEMKGFVNNRFKK